MFSVTGSHLAGWLFAAALGLVFTAGMATTDALNGLWVHRLVRSADRRAAAASRVMSLAIGSLSLAIAAVAAARSFVPGVSERIDAWGVAPGVAVVALVLAAYFAALRAASRAPAQMST
jgi:high-affinity nickel-transport protein